MQTGTDKSELRYGVLLVEVAGRTVDQEIRVTLTACGPSNGNEVKDVFGRPGAHVGVGSAH